MLVTSIRFISLLLTSLLAGAMFGIWLGYNPSALTATAYVEMQQNAIRALNTSLPVLGLACTLSTAVLAALTTNDTRSRYLLVAAALCLVVAGVVTRLCNQPINAVIMTWSAEVRPADWMQLRDTWWHWHIVRTVAGVSALALALLAAVSGQRGAS